jgi:hypothetical protein
VAKARRTLTKSVPQADLQRNLFAAHEDEVQKAYGLPQAWVVFAVGPDVVAEVQRTFREARVLPISSKSAGSQFIGDVHKEQEYADLNAHHRFYDPEDFRAAVGHFARANQSNLEAAVRSPFRVVNARVWATLPTSGYGTVEWHTDGFLDGHLKVMLFPNQLDVQHGAIQLENRGPLEEPAGTCLVFRNSDVMHRAVTGSLHERPVIEITLQRLLCWPADLTPIIGTNADRHLASPVTAYLP